MMNVARFTMVTTKVLYEAYPHLAIKSIHTDFLSSVNVYELRVYFVKNGEKKAFTFNFNEFAGMGLQGGNALEQEFKAYLSQLEI